jgi:hypothetical protein
MERNLRNIDKRKVPVGVLINLIPTPPFRMGNGPHPLG